MKPKFLHPIEPWIVNREWGVYDPLYAQFGFTLHNGVDTRLNATKFINAPFDGTVVRTGNQPNGGGIFMGVMSSEEFLFPDGITARVLVDFLHLERRFAGEGGVVFAEELVAKGDNTGKASTGEHLHSQWRRVKNWNGRYGVSLQWEQVDKNDANNSFDPTPFFASVEESVSFIAKFVEILKAKFKK